jgi:lambda repressor-like predicted transcriptional regulator
MLKIFISHSSRDVALAKHLITLLRSALRLPTEEIRCTSVPGYNLPGGVETDEHIRQEVLTTPVFIGLITESGLASAYVLFELGARWGTKQPLIPLLAPGISPDILQGPISNINALSCGSPANLHQLVNQIARTLNIEAEPAAGYQDELDVVSAYPALGPDTVKTTGSQSVPQTAVDRLAELRSEAISKILNRPVTSERDVTELSADTKNWWESVEAVLASHFSKAEQLNFTRLGTVPDVIFPHSFNHQHAKILREFALQERRLLDIIARHTR